MYEFSNVLVRANKLDESWRSRQPWIPKGESLDILYAWADRHFEWWGQMSGTNEEGPRWTSFKMRPELKNDEYNFSDLLSQNLAGYRSTRLADIMASLNRITK